MKKHLKWEEIWKEKSNFFITYFCDYNNVCCFTKLTFFPWPSSSLLSPSPQHCFHPLPQRIRVYIRSISIAVMFLSATEWFRFMETFIEKIFMYFQWIWHFTCEFSPVEIINFTWQLCLPYLVFVTAISLREISPWVISFYNTTDVFNKSVEWKI